MPVQTTVFPTQQLVLSEFWGVLTAEESLEGLRSMRHIPAFNPSFDNLCDFLRVTESTLTPEDSLEVISHVPFAKGSRQAIVMPVTPYQGESGVLRELAQNCGNRVRLFHTRREALEWLSGPRA